MFASLPKCKLRKKDKNIDTQSWQHRYCIVFFFNFLTCNITEHNKKNLFSLKSKLTNFLTLFPPSHLLSTALFSAQGFFQQFWEKAPGQNWEKMIDLTAKLGENNNIEHNWGSKIPKIKLF